MSSNKENQKPKLDADDQPIVSKEDEQETRDELMKIFKESNVEIHDGNPSYGSCYQKVKNEKFIDKINFSKKNEALYNIVKGFSWEERYEYVNMNKLKGNRVFKKGYYKEAKEIYMEAMVGLVFESGDQEKDRRMRDELQIPILLNIATCMINEELFSNAVMICNKACELNQNSMKAFCKRAQAYTGLINFDKASQDYSRAMELATNDQDKKDIMRLKRKMLSMKDGQKKKYKTMFEKTGNSNNGNIQGEQQNQNDCDESDNKTLSYNDDLEDLQKFGFLKYPAYPFVQMYKAITQKFGCKRKRRSRVDGVDQESSSEEDSD